jgi:hypothetical protein
MVFHGLPWSSMVFHGLLLAHFHPRCAVLPVFQSNLEHLDRLIVKTELRSTRHLLLVGTDGMDASVAAKISFAFNRSLTVLWERRLNVWRAAEVLDALRRRPVTS